MAFHDVIKELHDAWYVCGVQVEDGHQPARPVVSPLVRCVFRLASQQLLPYGSSLRFLLPASAAALSAGDAAAGADSSS